MLSRTVRPLLFVSLCCCLAHWGEGALASGYDTSALSAQMLQMVNGVRAQQGLPALRMDRTLALVATSHSRDMALHRFFDHTSPTLGSARDRVRRAGLSDGPVAENIALASSLQEAHQTLLSSPPHLRNMLSDRYDVCGIGIAVASNGQILVTQVFRRSGGPVIARRPRIGIDIPR
jgi:uncharacterized protein YkwD